MGRRALATEYGMMVARRMRITILRACCVMAALMPFHTAYLFPQPCTHAWSRYRDRKNESVWPRHAPNQTIGIPAKP